MAWLLWKQKRYTPLSNFWDSPTEAPAGTDAQPSWGRCGARRPATERREQLVAHVRPQVVLRQGAGDPHRLPHLFDVGVAAVAQFEMLGETAAGVRVQRAFEIVRDHFDKLVAVDLQAAGHARASSM